MSSQPGIDEVAFETLEESEVLTGVEELLTATTVSFMGKGRY